MNKNYAPKPIGPMVVSIAVVPLVMYATRFLEYSSSGLGGIALIGYYTILFPCMLACRRLVDLWKKD